MLNVSGSRGMSIAQFPKLSVVMSLEGHESCQNAVQKRHVKPLISTEFERINRIIVSLGVESAKHWRLLGCDANQTALPSCAVFIVCAGDGLNVCEKGVVVSLQRLMVAGLATKIKDQLQRADQRNCCANPALGNTKASKHVADCSCTKQYDRKIEYPVHTLKSASPRRMIEGVPESIETDVLAIWGHTSGSYFCGGGFGAGALGWRGPGPAPGPDVLGCLGPSELICISRSGWRTPNSRRGVSSFFPLIEHVSFCWSQKGMSGVGGRSYVPRHRQYNLGLPILQTQHLEDAA